MLRPDPCGGGHADWGEGPILHISHSLLCFVLLLSSVLEKIFCQGEPLGQGGPALGPSAPPAGLAAAEEEGGRGWGSAGQGAFSHWFSPTPAPGQLQARRVTKASLARHQGQGHPSAP